MQVEQPPRSAVTGSLLESRFVVANKLFTPIAGFVILTMIGRESAPLVGEYALVLTWYFVMQTLPLLGLTPFVMREAARRPNTTGRLFSSVALLVVVAAALLNLGARALLTAAPYGEATKQSVQLVALIAFPGGLAFLAEILLISRGHARLVAYFGSAENLLRVVGSIAVLHHGGGTLGLAAVLLGTRCFSFVALLSGLRAHTPDAFVAPDPVLLREIRGVLPTFFAQSVLALAMSRLDFVLLSFYASRVSLEDLGAYAIAYRLFEIALLVVSSVCLGLFPRLSHDFALSRAAFSTSVQTAAHYIVGLNISALLLALGFAELYVRLFFPRMFPVPVPLTQLYALALAPAVLDVLLSTVLNAANRQSQDLRALSVGCAIYAAGLFTLIPALGLKGAWLAGVLGISAQMLLRLRAIKAEGISVVSGRLLLYSLGSAVAGAGLVWWTAERAGLWSGPVAVVVVCLAMLLMAICFGADLPAPLQALARSVRSVLGQLKALLGLRSWLIVRANPVLENSYIFLYAQFVQPMPASALLGKVLAFVPFSFALLYYGYLLNDYADRDFDRRRDVSQHPPTNPFFERSTSYGRLVVVASLLANLPFVVFFSLDNYVFAAIWVVWVVLATSYSLPGIYLKARGLLGLVVVALALRTLPVLLFFVTLKIPIDWGWAAILVYVSLRGLSADLAHQRLHIAEDAGHGLHTFGVAQGLERATRLLRLNYSAERLGLLLVTGCIAVRIFQATRDRPGGLLSGLLGVSILALVIQAERRQFALKGLPDPHRVGYGRDVFYLLHKNFPKAVLPACMLAALLWIDAGVGYVLLALLLALYLRAFSWERIVQGLRLKPSQSTQ